MNLLAQWRKLVARLKAIWQMQDRYWKLDNVVAGLTETCRSLENRCMEADQRRVALVGMIESQQKQLADLRAIVANIREESKRGPLQARSAAHLRQFINQEDE